MKMIRDWDALNDSWAVDESKDNEDGKPLIMFGDMICVSAWLRSGQGQLSPAPGVRCNVRGWDTELTQTRVTCSHGQTLRQGSSLCSEHPKVL